MEFGRYEVQMIEEGLIVCSAHSKTELLSFFISSGLIECYLASNSIREAMVMANNVYKTLGANAQTLTLLATVCLEEPVTQEKAKTLLDKALMQRPDYIKAVVKKAELLSKFLCFFPPC